MSFVMGGLMILMVSCTRVVQLPVREVVKWAVCLDTKHSEREQEMCLGPAASGGTCNFTIPSFQGLGVLPHRIFHTQGRDIYP